MLTGNGRNLIMVVAIASALLVAGFQTEAQSDSHESGVREAAAGFYEALGKMFEGDAAPMSEVWSHADDVTYLGPQGGILVGWDKVLEAWEAQAALKLGGKVEPRDMQVLADGNIGITQNYEIGTSYIEGKAVTVQIRATNIFRLEDGKWKMISHHTDLLPALEKEQGKD